MMDHSLATFFPPSLFSNWQNPTPQYPFKTNPIRVKREKEDRQKEMEKKEIFLGECSLFYQCLLPTKDGKKKLRRIVSRRREIYERTQESFPLLILFIFFKAFTPSFFRATVTDSLVSHQYFYVFCVHNLCTILTLFAILRFCASRS